VSSVLNYTLIELCRVDVSWVGVCCKKHCACIFAKSNCTCFSLSMFWRFWPKKLTFNRHTKCRWCLRSHCNGLGLRSWPHILIDTPNAGVGLSSHLVKLLMCAHTCLVLILIIKVLALVIHTCPTCISDTFWSPINICLQTIKTIYYNSVKGFNTLQLKSLWDLSVNTPEFSPHTYQRMCDLCFWVGVRFGVGVSRF